MILRLLVWAATFGTLAYLGWYCAIVALLCLEIGAFAQRLSSGR